MLVTTVEKLGKDFILMRSKLLILLLLVTMGYSSCKKANSTTTNSDFFTPVYVYTNIDISFAQYNALQQMQGYLYLPGGYRGIIIYHTIDDQFVAFDRACPVKTDSACAYVSMDSVPIRFRCGTPGTKAWNKCCTSTFDAAYGSPLSGEAKRGLKQYYTSKQGTVIYISSAPL